MGSKFDQFESDLILKCVNMSHFDDELAENGVQKFESQHFNSKKVALFRTVMPSSISASQATPQFFAD